jgi:DNA modification methylase
MSSTLNEIVVGDAAQALKAMPADSVHTVVTSPPYWNLRDYGIRGQIGLETSMQEYVDRIADVFDEVRRVLRPDGTLWLVLGDGNSHGGCGARDPARWPKQSRNDHMPVHGKKNTGLKPKDLLGIPWRVAFALQGSGWWLRSEITWCKTAPMPESVEDRPVSATENVFLMTKSERYYYDRIAVRQPASEASIARIKQTSFSSQKGGHRDYGNGINKNRSARKTLENFAENPSANLRNFWVLDPEPFQMEMCTSCRRTYEKAEYLALTAIGEDEDKKRVCLCGSSDRWLSHFATFPQALVEPCILAGTSEHGVCPACGAQWKRVVERPQPPRELALNGVAKNSRDGGLTNEAGMERIGMSHKKYAEWLAKNPPVTTGWAPTCKCGTGEVSKPIVLDPFMGSGTVALVALKAGRNFIGVELNPDYAHLARARISHEATQKKMF